MEPTQPSGVHVGHLLQMQEALTRSFNESIDRHHTMVEARVRELIASQQALAEYQRVANGRLTKLEVAQARLRARVDQGASLFASMSKTQKAKLAAAIAVLLPLGVELMQRLIPVVLALAFKVAGLPAPSVRPESPPVLSPAPTPAPVGAASPKGLTDR
jgi:hypothetical protein